MNDPFRQLEVGELASDDEIKAAYLRKVREFPPERSPQQFQLIRESYEKIRTEKDRLSYQLFDVPEYDYKNVCHQLSNADKNGRPSEAQFRDFLAETVKGFTLSDLDQKN